MKKLLYIIAAIVLSCAVNAQKQDSLPSWKTGGVGSLSVSQLSLVNWSAGGDESVSGLALFNLFANYKKDSTLKWENVLDINYGLQQINNEVARKTDDKLEFSSKFGKRATSKLYYSSLFSFKTQMDEGTQDDTLRISDFLVPAYFILSVGIDYKPNDNLTILVAPLTGKTTLVNDKALSQDGAYGVDPGKKLRNEFGGYIKAAYVFTPLKNVDVHSKINLFSNYVDNPKNIDVDAELNVNMKINEYLSATVKTNLLYDHDVQINGTNSLLQFKEVFGIALSYKF